MLLSLTYPGGKRVVPCQAGLAELICSKLVCSAPCWGMFWKQEAFTGARWVLSCQTASENRGRNVHKGKRTKFGGFGYGMVYAAAGMLVSGGTHFFSAEGGDFAQELLCLIGTALN